MSKSFTTSKKPTITRLRKEAEAIAKGTKLGEMKADLKKPIEESLKEHLGKLIDRIEPINTALMAGLFYLGYEKNKDWKAGLVGPIGLALAQSPSEIAAAAGVATLIGLGISIVPGSADFANYLTGAISTLSEGLYEPTATDNKYQCKEGYTLMALGGPPYPIEYHHWSCVPNWQVAWYIMTGYTIVQQPYTILPEKETYLETYRSWAIYMVFARQADGSYSFIFYRGKKAGKVSLIDWSKERLFSLINEAEVMK